MKIVHITPGVGNSFYCQNCFRDLGLIRALNKMGHEIIKVPIYLPGDPDLKDEVTRTPLFFGAINVYLQEKLPFYKFAPQWFNKLLNSQKLLRFIANKTGSTKATGLEEMTISMLLGEKGNQADYLDEMINYLVNVEKPEIVHISNALLMGLAHRLKRDLNVKVVCSLQDENEWTDHMNDFYQKKILKLMGEKASDVDKFITASEFYKNKSVKHMNIPADKVDVIYGGIEIDGYEQSSLPMDPPVLGYLCRISEYFGFGILVDAFIKIKKEGKFPGIRLSVTGGYTNEDKKFIKKCKNKIAKAGYADDFTIYKDFLKEDRIVFLKTLTLLSVPVPQGESFGAYQLEALAAGIPIVQPDAGYFPEFIKNTGGGIIYNPNNSETLAEALTSLLSDRNKMKELSKKGKETLEKEYTIEHMAQKVIETYNNLLT